MSDLSQSDVLELFSYNNGVLVWQERSAIKGSIPIGEPAGSASKRGYIYISIRNKKYLAHRLIFLYHHGHFPQFVDHIDNDCRNNRIENLRECTQSQNSFNSRLSKANTSGIKGVHFNKRKQKWVAELSIQGKKIRLGRFLSREDAGDAVNEARKLHHKNFARNI